MSNFSVRHLEVRDSHSSPKTRCEFHSRNAGVPFLQTTSSHMSLMQRWYSNHPKGMCAYCTLYPTHPLSTRESSIPYQFPVIPAVEACFNPRKLVSHTSQSMSAGCAQTSHSSPTHGYTLHSGQAGIHITSAYVSLCTRVSLAFPIVGWILKRIPRIQQAQFPTSLW